MVAQCVSEFDARNFPSWLLVQQLAKIADSERCSKLVANRSVGEPRQQANDHHHWKLATTVALARLAERKPQSKPCGPRTANAVPHAPLVMPWPGLRIEPTVRPNDAGIVGRNQSGCETTCLHKRCNRGPMPHPIELGVLISRRPYLWRSLSWTHTLQSTGDQTNTICTVDTTASLPSVASSARLGFP